MSISSEEKSQIIKSLCVDINNRFLTKEIEAKETVQRMNTNIKNGCLIHALFECDGNIEYLIAKVEWADFLDSVSFKRNQGIEIDKKRLGKSCLFTLTKEGDEYKIDTCKVLLDNTAVYFWRDFLELEPACDDEGSTKKLTEAVINIIEKKLKKDSAQDRMLLRNAFVHYMKSNEFIDYQDMFQNVFKDYFDNEICSISVGIKKDMINSLEGLPEKCKFSAQFNCVSKAMKARTIKQSYKLLDFAELNLTGGEIKDILANIVSGTETASGKTFLKIYTENADAIAAFEESKE